MSRTAASPPAGELAQIRTMDPARTERGRILRDLRRRARPHLAARLREYLGAPLPTLGVSAPDLHRIVRESRRRSGPLDSARLRPLLVGLWSGGTYDERIVALELLDRHVEAHDEATWRLAARWVDQATGWALSDSLAAGPVARMVAEDPRRLADLLRWTRSRNFWRRRAATYALHDLVLAGDLDRPFALLERLRSDPEFWVQRAVGTWLRECWKKDRGRTERFLRRHARTLASVTLTVATERATKSLRTELRLAREARPPPASRGHAHMQRAR